MPGEPRRKSCQANFDRTAYFFLPRDDSVRTELAAYRESRELTCGQLVTEHGDGPEGLKTGAPTRSHAHVYQYFFKPPVSTSPDGFSPVRVSPIM